jgi:hypothetical protein
LYRRASWNTITPRVLYKVILKILQNTVWISGLLALHIPLSICIQNTKFWAVLRHKTFTAESLHTINRRRGKGQMSSSLNTDSQRQVCSTIIKLLIKANLCASQIVFAFEMNWYILHKKYTILRKEKKFGRLWETYSFVISKQMKKTHKTVGIRKDCRIFRRFYQE